MHRHRPILIALLIPLLLDLLVFFTALPATVQACSETCFQQGTVEMLFGGIESEERVEDEHSAPGFFSRIRLKVTAPDGTGPRRFHMTRSSAPALAFGWTMPLRI